VLILVSYDIPDDRRRTRLAHVLKDFGARVHYSVFECNLDAAQLETMRRRLLLLLDESEDSVRIYRICAECAPHREVLGQGTVREEPDVFIL
jgi:CRISPR-associated protein Cas2